MTPVVLLFIPFTLFVEPRVGKAQAKRLEEDLRSCRSCRHVYSLLPGVAAIAADMLYSLLPWLTQRTQLWCSSKYCCFLCVAHISLEKAMATHSSTLTWRIPWMEEPGRLQSMGSLSQTRLNNFTFTFHFYALEKEMTTFSSVLAWRIPGMGKPGGLPSMGSHRVGHDWSDLAAAAAYIPRTQSSLWPSKYLMMYMRSAISELSCYIVIIYKTWFQKSLNTPS